MPEYGMITCYNHDHHAGIIEAEEDGAQIAVDQHDLDRSDTDDLKRHYRVAFDRVEREDGHLHARNVQMLQPIGTWRTHRHIGDRRFRGQSRNPF
ncbi:hypothetical protein WJT74_06775 [Sphingomicrobium sp. XHP0239]|uniref:hypothetical protein n=1 Tax=Sphingomicrobium maritimum TaxID=3133972 RepID=UPI0031CC677A